MKFVCKCNYMYLIESLCYVIVSMSSPSLLIECEWEDKVLAMLSHGAVQGVLHC